MQKTLVVTGASTGLGVAIAIKAAQAGYKTYATMRDLSRRATLDQAIAEADADVEVLQLDVQDTDSVNAAVDQIIASDGRIDVLVNNAGVGFARTSEQATEADISWVMDVNLMGVVRATTAVLPHMRKARSGHVVSISSVGGLVGQPFNEIYCASKFAVEGYMESLASYVGPAFGIGFSLIEPGGIRSEFANSALKHFAETGGMIEDEYLPLIQSYLGAAQARTGQAGVYQTSDQVAEVVMACLALDPPPVRIRTSDWSEALCALKTDADPDGCKLQAQVIRDILGGLPGQG